MGVVAILVMWPLTNGDFDPVRSRPDLEAQFIYTCSDTQSDDKRWEKCIFKVCVSIIKKFLVIVNTAANLVQGWPWAGLWLNLSTC